MSARQRLAAGDVDQALAETMRLPGASRATDWIVKARRYIAVHRALDEIDPRHFFRAANSPSSICQDLARAVPDANSRLRLRQGTLNCIPLSSRT